MADNVHQFGSLEVNGPGDLETSFGTRLEKRESRRPELLKSSLPGRYSV